MRNTKVELMCPFCKKEHSVMVDESAYNEWKAGKLLQRAMPELSAEEREQLISRLCIACQDDVFGSGE